MLDIVGRSGRGDEVLSADQAEMIVHLGALCGEASTIFVPSA
jgi:hypothetical protein